MQQIDAAPASAPERADVVHTFLASVAHLEVKRAERETGVPCAVVQRLRAGRASTVNGKTLDRMLAHLRTVEHQPREQQPGGRAPAASPEWPEGHTSARKATGPLREIPAGLLSSLRAYPYPTASPTWAICLRF
jgi:hypothetical protein